MDTKLTLKLDSFVIEQAKSYAKEKKLSLSQLIEGYLSLLTSSKKEAEITPLVKSLSGILGEDFGSSNYKDEYKKHLLNKYSK